MRINELHKFSNGTLNDVRSALDDILKQIRMEYLPQTVWRNVDRERAGAMIQAIDRQLRNRRLLRSLENSLVGDCTGETFDCWKGPYDLSYDVLIKTAGNPVKEILLKLNLPDHRSILTDSKEYIKRDMEVFKITFSHSSQDKGTSSSLKSMITRSNHKLMIEVKDYELKTKDKA
ncbi:hypothetical protein Tco_0812466 [Tanacetum coccineum]